MIGLSVFSCSDSNGAHGELADNKKALISAWDAPHKSEKENACFCQLWRSLKEALNMFF